MERPRILFVGAFPPPHRRVFGGMVTSCRALVRSSFADRVSLDLLDSTQISNPIPPLPVRALLAVRRLIQYVLKFERNKPNAVMLFVALGGSILEKGVMAWYARLRGVPAIIFPRGGGGLIDACSKSTFTTFWVKRSFSGARAVFCQGESVQRFMIERLGFRRWQAPVIANWTATNELLDIGRARRHAAKKEPVRLLFLGWLDREKGTQELLDAVRDSALSGACRLDIVGEGNHSDAARAFVKAHGLQAKVHFHGWLHGEALLNMMASNDVLVLPSWAEGLPNAMIEGMAAGLAIVVSAVGSIPDVVRHEESALLVPPRDVTALREALARVIADADLRERLAAAGRALAEKEFGVEAAVDRIVHELNLTLGASVREP